MECIKCKSAIMHLQKPDIFMGCVLRCCDMAGADRLSGVCDPAEVSRKQIRIKKAVFLSKYVNMCLLLVILYSTHCLVCGSR